MRTRSTTGPASRGHRRILGQRGNLGWRLVAVGPSDIREASDQQAHLHPGRGELVRLWHIQGEEVLATEWKGTNDFFGNTAAAGNVYASDYDLFELFAESARGSANCLAIYGGLDQEHGRQHEARTPAG